MKTLGFGLRSLRKDPRWAQAHGINPDKQTAGSVVGDAKANQAKGAEQSIFNRAKSGDVNGVANQNNIFTPNRVQGANTENNIFAQSKIGGAGNQKANIFEMMNKIDEQHKSLAGSAGLQAPIQPENNNAMGENELQKKLGRKLNMMM